LARERMSSFLAGVVLMMSVGIYLSRRCSAHADPFSISLEAAVPYSSPPVTGVVSACDREETRGVYVGAWTRRRAALGETTTPIFAEESR